jgi:anti-sigma regulatory factor (Ser/Thr protein kinase)
MAGVDGRLDGRPLASSAIEPLILTFDSEHLYALRSTVAAHASAFGLPEPRVSDVVLVAHELASNAVRHGGVSPQRPGQLRLWWDRTAVVCEVRDSGPGLINPNTAGMQAVPVAAPSGRGLWIIRRIADEVEISTGAGGTTVTAALRFDVLVDESEPL